MDLYTVYILFMDTVYTGVLYKLYMLKMSGRLLLCVHNANCHCIVYSWKASLFTFPVMSNLQGSCIRVWGSTADYVSGAQGATLGAEK